MLITSNNFDRRPPYWTTSSWTLCWFITLSCRPTGQPSSASLLADAQALTDNADNPDKSSQNILQVALDYLAVGIDPTKTTICVQSCLPALNELTMLYLNFVTVARLERNPTIKSEIQMRGFERDIPAGSYVIQ